MSLQRFLILLLLAGAGLAPVMAASAPSVEVLVAACIEKQFTPERDEVFRDAEITLRKECPRLARAFEAQTDPRLRDLTPRPGLKPTLSQLLDLQQALRSYHTLPQQHGRPLDRAALDGIISETWVPFEEQTRELTLFERFNRWLETQLKRITPDDVEPVQDWIERLGLTPHVREIILQVAIVLLILLTLFIVFNELRAGTRGGFFRRLGFRALRRLRRRGTTAPSSGFTWAQLRDMTPRQRLVALLRYELGLLVRRRFILRAENHTNREIARQLATRQVPCAKGFGQLVPIVDPILYGEREADEETLRRIEAIVRETERCADDEAAS